MKLNIHAYRFDLTDEIRDYAAEKIGKLDKYYKNIVQADIKLESEPGDTANVRYMCKVAISVPGENIIADEKSDDIKKAIDFVESDLKRQLSKKKEKENPKKLARAKEAVRRFFGKEE